MAVRSSEKVDIKTKGLNSIKNDVVQQNLMGRSRVMNKKDWVDAQGRKGRVSVPRACARGCPCSVRGSPNLGSHARPPLLARRSPARARPRAQGFGVYRFEDKYGANVDGYSPIYTPDQWTPDGQTYKLGTKGLIAWCVARVGGCGRACAWWWCGLTPSTRGRQQGQEPHWVACAHGRAASPRPVRLLMVVRNSNAWRLHEALHWVRRRGRPVLEERPCKRFLPLPCPAPMRSRCAQALLCASAACVQQRLLADGQAGSVAGKGRASRAWACGAQARAPAFTPALSESAHAGARL